MKKLLFLLLTLTMLLISCTAMAAGKLETITTRGTLLVGTTGDYKPMSYLDKETGKYEGFDYQLAENLAAALGVKAVYVPTTWKTLTQDTLDGKFDVALCGITRTFAREKVMDMSDGYLQFGKTITQHGLIQPIVVRKADAGKFKTLEDINKPGVKVMYNPGGTNEKFALANLSGATLVMHPQNAEIPGLIAEGKADVMVTETTEAAHYAAINDKLAAPLLKDPFTKNTFGVLMQKGDQDFLNFVNFWLAELKGNGTLAQFEKDYIK